MGKIDYNIDYSKERPSINFEGKLSSEDIFFVHELCKYLLSDIVVRESKKESNQIKKEFIVEILDAIDTLEIITDIGANLLKELSTAENELNDILDKLNIDKDKNGKSKKDSD